MIYKKTNTDPAKYREAIHQLGVIYKKYQTNLERLRQEQEKIISRLTKALEAKGMEVLRRDINK